MILVRLTKEHVKIKIVFKKELLPVLVFLNKDHVKIKNIFKDLLPDNNNFQKRKLSHKLATSIEQYRYCTENVDEDGTNFILECPLYENEAKAMIDIAFKNCKNNHFLNKYNQFIWLLPCKNEEVFKSIALYII